MSHFYVACIVVGKKGNNTNKQQKHFRKGLFCHVGLCFDLLFAVSVESRNLAAQLRHERRRKEDDGSGTEA